MNLSSALLGKQLGVEGFFFWGGEGVSGPHLPTFGLNKFPYLVKMRENADQKNSKYRHFLRSVFKSSSMFFADQSHVNFIFYLVLVFTALRNSDNFLFVNLTNLLQPDVKRVQSRASQFLYCCDESLSSKANKSRHKHKKGKKLQGALSERLIVTVKKYIYCTDNKIFN